MINLSSHGRLLAISIQSPPLPLERKEHIHGSDGLSLGMLSVSDSVTNHILKEHLQYTPGLFIDQARDPLYTAPSGQTANVSLGDVLDVVPQDLPVPLGTSLSKAFASLATTSHVAEVSGPSEKILCQQKSRGLTSGCVIRCKKSPQKLKKLWTITSTDLYEF